MKKKASGGQATGVLLLFFGVLFYIGFMQPLISNACVASISFLTFNLGWLPALGICPLFSTMGGLLNAWSLIPLAMIAGGFFIVWRNG